MDDVTGLGRVAEKLIEEVSKAIGTAYKPRGMRREADAEAYRVKGDGTRACRGSGGCESNRALW